MDKHTGKEKTVSLANYKKKLDDKLKRIKAFEEGPQALPGCTCGEHTDPNRFLTERQVTRHYLKDRKRYVDGLNGVDPMADYMPIIHEIMNDARDAPLKKIFNRHNQKATLELSKAYFEKGIMFYETHFSPGEVLSDEGRREAEILMQSFKTFQKKIAKELIQSYLIDKRAFNSEYASFARKKTSENPNGDSLDIPINDTKGYIDAMAKHFQESDTTINRYIITKTAGKLGKLIHKKLNGDFIPTSSLNNLNDDLQNALREINQRLARNLKRDYKAIKEEYEKVKHEYSIEYKAMTLIDLELKKRTIEPQSNQVSKATVNDKLTLLMESINMENLIEKLATEELETLYDQLEEQAE